MTKEELKRIRCYVTKEHLWTPVVDRTTALALLDEIDFLRQLVHDLKEESTAYKHGLEDGEKRERDSCVALCERVRQEYGKQPTHSTSVNSNFWDGIVYAARCCADLIRGRSDSNMS